MGLERRLIGKEHMLVLSTQLNTLLYLKKTQFFTFIYLEGVCHNSHRETEESLWHPVIYHQHVRSLHGT